MEHIKQKTYFVKGTHCASCELIIEKTLLQNVSVKAVDASNSRGEVVIHYEGEQPTTEKLNRIFKEQGYSFSDKPWPKEGGWTLGDWLWSLGAGVLAVAGFLALTRSGVVELAQVGSGSSLPAFFVFGLIAGLSTCAALVGGLVLSMAKQWSEIYAKETPSLKKFEPHLMFNFGRLASYFILGAVLGGIGSKLQISLGFSALLILGVSVLMVLLALQMLGVRSLGRFQIGIPKLLTRYVANEKNFRGKYMPMVLGALTFFLPCGFTITSQGLALISGSWLQGGLIMLFFALGTTPVLLAIGLSSLKLLGNQVLANRFLRAAGVLVLFFALFNINNQLNVLGMPSFSDLSLASPVISNVDNVDNNAGVGNANNNNRQANGSGANNSAGNSQPPLAMGQQVIKMKASSSGYSPNYFKVLAGASIRWEIEDIGTSGCTNAVIARGLFSGDIPLTPGQTSVKEFTAPQKPGKYKFSCWMGMVSGIIEVVDNNSANNPPANKTDGVSEYNNETVVPSGASGCGCGGR